MVCRALAAFLPRHDPAMETGKRTSTRQTWLSKKSCYPCEKVLLFFWCLGSKPNSPRSHALFASLPATQPHLTRPRFHHLLWGRPEGWECGLLGFASSQSPFTLFLPPPSDPTTPLSLGFLCYQTKAAISGVESASDSHPISLNSSRKSTPVLTPSTVLGKGGWINVASLFPGSMGSPLKHF